MAIESLRDVARASVSAFSVGGGASGYYEGPTAPDPGEFPLWFNTTDGVFLVRVGSVWVEPGSPSGSATVYTVEVDFGVGATSKMFSVALAGAAIGQKVIASPSLEMPAGVAPDELEMDPIMCAASIVATDFVRLAVGSTSVISGKRNINLILG